MKCWKSKYWKNSCLCLKLNRRTYLVETLMTIVIKKLIDAAKNTIKANKNCFRLPPNAQLLQIKSCTIKCAKISERINSAESLIVAKDKVKLDSSTSDKLITLRMSKDFMTFAQHNKHRDNANYVTWLDEIVDADEEV